MSVTLEVALKGLEAQVTIDHGYETTPASSIVFDEDANVVAETSGNRYSGFCLYCVAYEELMKSLAWRRQIEPSDVVVVLEAKGYSCTCEDDEEVEDYVEAWCSESPTEHHQRPFHLGDDTPCQWCGDL